MTTTPHYQSLSNTLFRERQLLELLVFKLEEEQLLLAAARTRWLHHATREVEAVLERLRAHELERAMQADDVARRLGIEDVDLRTLAARAPAPWDQIFATHHEALANLVLDIDTLAATNRELLARGQQATTEALDRLGDTTSAPFDERTRPRDETPLGFVDRVM
jgi:hypothetical protein